MKINSYELNLKETALKRQKHSTSMQTQFSAAKSSVLCKPSQLLVTPNDWAAVERFPSKTLFKYFQSDHYSIFE